MTDLPLERVLAWRVRRQFLDRPLATTAIDVARRLCGLQAQVPSSADQAIAVRVPVPRQGAAAAALAKGELVRTWAVPAYLGAFGPASPTTFDAWLLRGVTPKKRLAGWFESSALVQVTVDGRELSLGLTRL